MNQSWRYLKRVGTAVVGGIVVIVGIIAIPYPGPGWLIVFAGLAILATEFVWAERLLKKGRGYYDHWTAWLARQPRLVRLLVLSVTGIVVGVTVWLVNGFGILNAVLNLHWNWLQSPLVR